MRAGYLSFLLILCTFCCTQQDAFAQPELPALQIETLNAKNIISWTNSYDGVKSIIVQRSDDSVFNFTTIGFLSNPKPGMQSYEDQRPLPGKNYYRVCLIFTSNIEWFSNTYKVILDSALIAKSRTQKLQTGSTNAKGAGTTTNTNNTITSYTDFYYEPSTQVYTNPYTGHVTISLADAEQKRYSIKFFNPQKEEVLYISRIKNRSVVLDKYNFNARGTYSFQLFDADVMVETGYVSIY